MKAPKAVRLTDTEAIRQNWEETCRRTDSLLPDSEWKKICVRALRRLVASKNKRKPVLVGRRVPSYLSSPTNIIYGALASNKVDEVVAGILEAITLPEHVSKTGILVILLDVARIKPPQGFPPQLVSALIGRFEEWRDITVLGELKLFLEKLGRFVEPDFIARVVELRCQSREAAEAPEVSEEAAEATEETSETNKETNEESNEEIFEDANEEAPTESEEAPKESEEVPTTSVVASTTSVVAPTTNGTPTIVEVRRVRVLRGF